MKKKDIEKLNNMKVEEKLVTKEYTYEVCEGHCDGNCVGLYEEDCCFYESDMNCTRIVNCSNETTVDNKSHYFRRTKNNNKKQVQEKDNLTKLIDIIEDIDNGLSMLNIYQLGIALKVMEDRLWNIDSKLAQRCNDIQHKLLEVEVKR